MGHYIYHRSKVDNPLTQLLERTADAKRPSTPSPSGHESTKKPRTTGVLFKTPDSQDRVSAGKQGQPHLESIQAPNILPCPMRPKGTTPQTFHLGESELPTPDTGNDTTRQEWYKRELPATPTKSRGLSGLTLNSVGEDEDSDSYGWDEDLEIEMQRLADKAQESRYGTTPLDKQQKHLCLRHPR